MKAIDLRVREETLALARALCEQRNLERAAWETKLSLKEAAEYLWCRFSESLAQ